MANYKNQYFTIRSRENGNAIYFKIGSSNMTTIATSISYSTDNGVTWTTEGVVNSKTVSVNVNSGDTVMWKGIANSWCYNDSNYGYGSTFTASKFFDVEGNIMSLLYGDDFADKTVFVSNNTFAYLFSESDKLVNAENLVLPATTLKPYCYRTMFQNCYALQTSPKELPATTLVESCYRGMFQYCSGMTTAPFLPDATLASNSCFNLFRYCSGITSVVCLHSDTSTSYHNSWMNAVATTGTFYKNPNATWSTGTSGIPTNWTIKDYVPFPESASTFTSDGGSATYSLETQASWNAISDSNWLIVSPISGTGDETLSITVKKNSDYDSGRTGTVTVTDTNDNILLLWTVEQERKKYLIKLMNLWKNGTPINKLIIDEDARYQSFVNLGAVSGNTIEYTTTVGTMIQVPRTGWGSPLLSNTYNDGGVLTFLGQPTAIAPNAFSGSDITTFTVQDSVSAIGANAFAECAEIEELTLGENISAIGAGAFSGCSNLAYIEAESDAAPTISADTFYGVAEGGTLKHNPGTDYSTWLSDDPYYLGYYGWTEQTVIDYSTKYFTIRSLADNNTINVLTGKNIQMSTDDGTTWTSAGNVTLNSGATLLLKRNDSANSIYTTVVTAAASYEVYGNLNSLVMGDNFATTGTLSNNCFRYLFRYEKYLVSAENLVFPWENITGQYTFAHMFQYCSGLTSTPSILPATGLTRSGYEGMFEHCGGLVHANITLPATALANYCYYYMFNDCPLLEESPVLPAASLVSNCYGNMFSNCAKLNKITCLATSITGTGNWVQNAGNGTGTFIKAAGASWSTGNAGIPSGWTVQDYQE